MRYRSPTSKYSSLSHFTPVAIFDDSSIVTIYVQVLSPCAQALDRLYYYTIARMTSNHGITIRGATQADVPGIATTVKEIFKDTAVENYLRPWKDEYPRDYRRETINRTKTRLRTPGIHPFVAVEEKSGEIVGFAMWRRLGNSDQAKGWQKDTLINSE
jgi:hypothetical protein